MAAIGISDFLKRNFKTFPFEGEWQAHLGLPEKNFQMIVYGKPGNGKTDYVIKLCKYLASLGGRVYYNSFEEGISCTLQEAVRRNHLEEVAGKIIFGNKETIDEMIARLSRKNSANIVVIDSRDYMNLTTEQYKRLVARFPRKVFIIICWESGGKPKSQYAKDIEYMCDIKVNVRNFQAYPRCRFGGNGTLLIWKKTAKEGEQIELV
jgi:hypothetical protein